MKTIRSFLLALVLLAALCNAVLGQKGVVSHRVRGCDFFLIFVEKSDDYVLAEWYAGYEPEKEDVIYGSLSSFGFKDVNYSRSRKGRIYIEDYGLDKDDALEQLLEECD